MYTMMYFQNIQSLECFLTHITAIWTFPSMYKLMYIQIFQ